MAEYLSVSITHSVPLGTRPSHVAIMMAIKILQENLRRLGGKSHGRAIKVHRGQRRYTIHYIFPDTLSLTMEQRAQIHGQIRTLEHAVARVIHLETPKAVMKTVMSGAFIV